jgi:hypothetical protein
MYEGSREYGLQSDVEDEEVGLTNATERKENPDLADIIQTLRTDSFAHVYADAVNEEMLNQLIKDANEFSDPETVGKWKQLLTETSTSLMAEEDADVIKIILREALTEASLLEG